MPSFSPLVCILGLLDLVAAYSFSFSSHPTQCQPLTVNIVGQGKPPYRLLLADGNPEYESGKWTDVQFSGPSHTIEALQWPAGSQLVAMVSDQDGIGTGGTTELIRVSDSANAGCDPQFKYDDGFFHWDFRSAISSCKPTNLSIWTNLSAITPPLNGFVMLLNGQSFALDLPAPFKSLEQAWFQWLVDVPPESYFIMGLGDATNDLKGTMHYPHFVGDSGDTSCLDARSPRVTPGLPGSVSASRTASASSLPAPPSTTSPMYLPGPIGPQGPPDTLPESASTASSSTAHRLAYTAGPPKTQPMPTADAKARDNATGVVAGALGATIGLLCLGAAAFAFWWRTAYTKRVRAAWTPSSYSLSLREPSSASSLLLRESCTPAAQTPAAQKMRGGSARFSTSGLGQWGPGSNSAPGEIRDRLSTTSLEIVGDAFPPPYAHPS